jgi:hypothetical protein
MHNDWIGWVIGVIGILYGLWSDAKRKSDREWVHMALANHKPGIQWENRTEVIDKINNMMAFLRPPPKK